MQADRAALNSLLEQRQEGKGSAGRAKSTTAKLGVQEWMGGNVTDDTSRLKNLGKNGKVESLYVTPFRQSVSLSDGLVFIPMLQCYKEKNPTLSFSWGPCSFFPRYSLHRRACEAWDELPLGESLYDLSSGVSNAYVSRGKTEPEQLFYKKNTFISTLLWYLFDCHW